MEEYLKWLHGTEHKHFEEGPFALALEEFQLRHYTFAEPNCQVKQGEDGRLHTCFSPDGT